MKTWVQLSIPMETASEVDLNNADYFPAWMRAALGLMVMHPEMVFIKLVPFEDAAPTRPATLPPPGETQLTPPSSPIEQQVASLLNELEF